MKKRNLIFLGFAAATALTFWIWTTFLVTRRAPDTLLLSGNIEAHESVLGFQVPGKIADLIADEGKWVEKDAILARLDDRDYRQQVAHDRAALEVARAQLTLALAGPRRQQVEQAHQAMLDARAELAQRKLDFRRADELIRENAISQDRRDQAETALKRAQAGYEQAVQNYDQALEGTRKEDIDIARANAGRAEQALRLSEIQLDHTILRAPHDGVVTVRQSELGEVVAAGSPVMTVADLDHVWLRAYVSETDLGRVRWGQGAAVRTDTFPGKGYTGRVSFIASEAEFTPKSVETHKERVTLVYRIKIDVSNPNHELKPGMPADVTIDLRTPADERPLAAR